MPPVSPDGIRSVRRTVASVDRHGRHALDRADPADHRGGLVRQRGVLAEHRLAGRDRQQVRTDPVQLGQQGRAARLGDAEDRHHRRDPDRDPERGERRTEPACAEAAARDPAQVEHADPAARRGAERERPWPSCRDLLRLDAAVADVDAARQRGRDLAVVGDHEDRRAVLGLQLAEELRGSSRRSPCRGCRSARRRGRAPAVRRGPGRSPRADARRRTGRPAGASSDAPARRVRAPPPRRPAVPVPGSRGRAGRRPRCRARSRPPSGRTAGTRTRSATPEAPDSCRSDSPARSCPAIRTVPSVARSSVPMRWSSVDLPEPDGPTIAASSPSSTRRSTPRRASTGGVPGYRFVTPASSTTALTTAPPRCRPRRARRRGPRPSRPGRSRARHRRACSCRRRRRVRPRSRLRAARRAR